MFYYYSEDFYYDCFLDEKLPENENFTKIKPPIFDKRYFQAYFIKDEERWEIREKVFFGNFIDIVNNKLVDTATALEIETNKKAYFNSIYCLNKLNEEYEKAQYLDLVNGKTINIQIKGKLYEELITQYSRGKLTNVLKLIVKSFDNTKLVISRVEVILPIKFAKQILAKIQDISYKNFKTKQILLKKIEDENLTNEELFALNYDFIYNSKINIENEAELFINSGNATQEDIEFLQEKLKTKQFFIDL